MKKCILTIAIILSAVVISSEASATSFVQRLIATTAERYGVPTFLALKVAKVESSFTCDAEGKAGELGPLQIKPATARMIGYHGLISALRSCGAGLEWGMKHLALAIRAGGVWKHNQGLAAKVKSPAAAEYERRVMSQSLAPTPFDTISAVTSPRNRPRLGLNLSEADRSGLFRPGHSCTAEQPSCAFRGQWGIGNTAILAQDTLARGLNQENGSH